MHQLVADSSDPIPKPTILLGVLNMEGKDELVAFVLPFLGTIIAPIHFIEATMLHDLGLVECRLWDLIFQLWIAYKLTIAVLFPVVPSLLGMLLPTRILHFGGIALQLPKFPVTWQDAFLSFLTTCEKDPANGGFSLAPLSSPDYCNCQ
jgi:hypothetical protein